MKYKGEAGLLAVALIWGSGFVGSNIAIGFFTPYQVMGVRFFISAVCLLLVFAKRIRQIDLSTWKRGLMLGLMLYIGFLLQTVGLVYTTPSKNAFLTAINVIIVPFISLILYRRPVDRYGVGGAFAAIAGVGLISLNLDLSVNIGDVLTILCAVCFAFQIFYTGEFLKQGSDPVSLTITQMSVAAFIGIAVAAATTFAGFGEAKGGASWQASFMAIVYLAIFSTTIAFLLQTISQKNTNAVRTAVILSAEAVFGTLFSVILLHEQLSLRVIIGSVLVFAGIIIAEVKPGDRAIEASV